MIPCLPGPGISSRLRGTGREGRCRPSARLVPASQSPSETECSSSPPSRSPRPGGYPRARGPLPERRSSVSRSRLIDLRPVELVVPEDVEDVRGARPVIRNLVNKPFGVGRKVARKDDDVRRRVVLRHKAAALEVEVGEDLDLHGSFNPRLAASCEARGGSRASGPPPKLPQGSPAPMPLLSRERGLKPRRTATSRWPARRAPFRTRRRACRCQGRIAETQAPPGSEPAWRTCARRAEAPRQR